MDYNYRRSVEHTQLLDTVLMNQWVMIKIKKSVHLHTNQAPDLTQMLNSRKALSETTP